MTILNTKQLRQVFAVDAMCIYNWRFPLKTSRKTGLLFFTRRVGERHRVFFKWGEVRKWARKNAVLVVVHPKDLPKEVK